MELAFFAAIAILALARLAWWAAVLIMALAGPAIDAANCPRSKPDYDALARRRR